MKNQWVRWRSPLLLWGLLFSFWCGLSACSKSTIQGRVFLDENNNGFIDSNEIGAPFAKVSVIKDKQLITKGLTRQDGTFSLTTKKSGTFVFQLDLVGSTLEDFQRQADSGGQTFTPKAGEVDFDGDDGFKATETEPADEGAQTQGGAGPSSAGSSSTASTTGTGSTAGTQGGSGGTGGNSNADDADDDAGGSGGGEKVAAGGSSGSGEDGKEECGSDGWTGEGYSVCVERGKTKVALIAVKVDIPGALDRWAFDASKKTCKFGIPCSISIARIPGSSVDIVLPDQSTVASQPGTSYNSAMSLVSIEPKFNAPAPLLSSSMKATVAQGAKPSLQPTLSIAELSFTLPVSLPEKSLDVTLRPVMWHGGTKYELKERQISFIRDISASLHISLVSSTKVRVTLKNEGSMPIDKGTILVQFTTDNVPVTVTNPGGGNNLGQAVEYVVDDPIAPQGEKSWEVTHTPIGNSENDTNITISSTAILPYIENPIEANPATRFKAGIPPPDEE